MQEFIHDGRPFTTAEARQFGYTRGLLSHALETRMVRRLFRGVYVDSHIPDSRQLRLRAIDLVRPADAIVEGETAAWLMGVYTFKPSDQHVLEPSFVVPHSSTRIERVGVRCRQAIIDAGDLTAHGGLLTTNPLRTTSDLLRRLYRPYALAAADGMARAGLIQIDDLVDFVARLKGYRGIVQARSLSTIIEPRAQSPGESWQRLRIHDAGLPPPEVQLEVVNAFGESVFLDHAYPEVLVGSEYDGREYHTDPRHRSHDTQRRKYLSDVHGWRWVNADRDRIFGPDPSFEQELGRLLGVAPLLPRRWGFGR